MMPGKVRKHPEFALLLMVAVLVACMGCASGHSPDKQTILPQTSPPIDPAGILTVTPTLCPPTGNITPWIHLDPVVDHIAGENFSITGTTNLKAGEILSISIVPYQPSANKRRYYDFTEINGNAIVGCGNDSTNTWSFSEGLPHLISGYYIVDVTGENATFNASAGGDFNVIDNRTYSS